MKEVSHELLKLFINNPIFITVIVLGIICAVFYKQIIGWFGEHWTKKALRRLPKKYKIINDLLISINGKTHQIDHVIVSSYGIFSIETKQYNGYITGSKYDKNWIGHVGKKKYYIYNPIRQNYGHCKALEELLKIDIANIYNIVCIPSNAKINIKNDGEIVRYDTIIDKILSYKEKVIDNVDEIYEVLIKNNIKDKKIRKEHIKNVKKKSESSN